MSRPAIWLPFLIVAAFQLLALLLFTQFHHKALLPIALPLIRLTAGEGATHYPNLFYALPTMFFRANLAIDAVVAAIAGGAATVLFARAFGFEHIQRPWTRAFKTAAALIISSALLLALIFATSRLERLVPRELFLNDAMIRWGTRAVMLGIFVLLQSFLVYMTAWIVLMGHNVFAAVRDSLRVTAKTFIPTVLIVGVAAVLFYPISYASSRIDLIAGKLSPELIAGLLSLQIVVQIIITFILVGAIVRLFMWRVEAAR
jgi:hypothetical protein